MKTVGIVAEYNPFHKGHAYQIQKAKEAADADFAVIVMSPDFVQRGEPALIDKYCRTQMALENGADLVLELPVCYACGSAEYFAEGAISLLDQLGCIDFLSFGCETNLPALFSSFADLLLEESDGYRQKLRMLQKQGMTFPKARETALLEQLAVSEKDPQFLSAAEFLSSPNNILGLEYTKALKKRHSQIELLPIERRGSHYHSVTFEQEFCSASAVRALLTDPQHLLLRSSEEAWLPLSNALPEGVYSLLQTAFFSEQLTVPEQFSSLLHYKLLSEASAGFDRYLDVTPDLSDRIRNLLPEYCSFSQFAALVKTKQLTEARIRRALLHILLGILQEETEEYRRQGSVFYARVLGFKKAARPLLHQIKSSSEIPMLTKLADAKKILSSTSFKMLTQDISASHIYQLAHNDAQPLHNEYTRSPILL